MVATVIGYYFLTGAAVVLAKWLVAFACGWRWCGFDVLVTPLAAMLWPATLWLWWVEYGEEMAAKTRTLP